MAQSRLEKIGTIFSRVTGLIRSGAMKSEDRPIWYDVYAAFPPKAEPRFDRPATKMPLRKILYEEDRVRAKYQKSIKLNEIVNLVDTKRETQTQQFLRIYNELKAQGALDDERIFETAQELCAEQRQTTRTATETNAAHTINTEDDIEFETHRTLLTDFKEATKEITSHKSDKRSTEKGGSGNINITNLFKD